MAKNVILENGDQVAVACTDPAVPVSGDPVLYGQMPGVALTNEDANGKTTVKRNGKASFQVKGVTTSGANSAVAEGDILYYVPGNTPKLSKAVGDTGAVRFGYAAGTVTAGSTATIEVLIGY